MKTLLLALLFAATPALAEQLYVVGESKTHRYLIDVHTIKVHAAGSNEDPRFTVKLIGVNLDTGETATGAATALLSTCDNEGGRGEIALRGYKEVVWAKSGTRIYDSLFQHTCEWLLVILKKNPDQLFGTTTPKPTKPKVQA